MGELALCDLINSWQQWLFPVSGCPDLGLGQQQLQLLRQDQLSGVSKEGPNQACLEGLLTCSDTRPPLSVSLKSRTQRVLCHPERMKMKQGTWDKANIHARQMLLRCLFVGVLWTELCPPKFRCWSPNPSMSIFGDRAFKEVKLHEIVRVGP